MERDNPARWQESHAPEDEERAILHMVHAITATIYSSGEDYDRAVQDFFAQIEALGLLVGAEDLEEVGAYLRHASRLF